MCQSDGELGGHEEGVVLEPEGIDPGATDKYVRRRGRRRGGRRLDESGWEDGVANPRVQRDIQRGREAQGRKRKFKSDLVAERKAS